MNYEDSAAFLNDGLCATVVKIMESLVFVHPDFSKAGKRNLIAR